MAKEPAQQTGTPAAPGAAAAAPARRKKAKRMVSEGVVHIHSTFNNTIISIADPAGNVVVWATAGSAGFKGARKGTPFAAQVAAEQAARKAAEMGMRTDFACPSLFFLELRQMMNLLRGK